MASLPTPIFSHLTMSDYDKVYEPAEDTFFMMDALEKDINKINEIKPTIILEIGPGSGGVITFLSKHLDPGAAFFASDINPHAATCTKATSRMNNTIIEVTIDDMAYSFRKRLRGKIDVIIFNPPYVVTPSHEVGGNDLTASWAGGIDGREVIDNFLPVAAHLLSKVNGMLYLLLLKENKPEEIVRLMEAKYNMHSHTVIERKTGPEYLSVVRFSYNEIT